MSTYISSTTTTVGDLLATDIQNYESSDDVEYLELKNQEKSQQITKSSMHPLDTNTTLPQNEGMLIGITIQVISNNI